MPRRWNWAQVPVSHPALDRYLEQVAATHVNGGYLIGRWRAAGDPVVVDSDHLRIFFDEVVRKGLPELRIPRPLTVDLGLVHQWAGSLCLDGVLAGLIVNGGAYERYEGPASEAKALAVAAVEALTQNRFADFRVDISQAAWTPWFHDIAWDHTFVLTDFANAELTVLCVTDTD